MRWWTRIRGGRAVIGGAGYIGRSARLIRSSAIPTNRFIISVCARHRTLIEYPERMSVTGSNRRLSWADYSKVNESLKPPYSANTHAELTPDCRYSYSPDGSWKIVHTSVAVTIDKARSWIVKGHESKDLLIHEQGHYDIMAIGGRDLERRLVPLKGSIEPGATRQATEDAVKAAVQAALDEQTAKISAEIDKIQDMYDEDMECGTNHGLQTHWQTLWKHAIINAKNNPKSQISDLEVCPAETSD